MGALYGFGNIYFQAGKLYYTSAPILVGWAIGFIVARQRLKAVWPTVAWLLIAWMGATAQIHASRTTVPGGLELISMSFFGPGPSRHDVFGELMYAVVIFSFTVLPYLIWRLQRAISV